MSRRRGGQPGNSNALRHGLYSAFVQRVLADTGRKLPERLSVGEEIDAVRVLLADLLATNADIELIFRATALIGRLVTLETVIVLKIDPGPQSKTQTALPAPPDEPTTTCISCGRQPAAYGWNVCDDCATPTTSGQTKNSQPKDQPKLQVPTTPAVRQILR